MSSSLTSPNDREQTPSQPKQTDPLTLEQTADAIADRVHKFPLIDRYYADPSIMNQKICLVSFVPAKGATPDKDNFFGMMKVRGVFATEEEANERAEFLIRNVDSYHDIYHAYVGRPFPITTSRDYSAEVKNIDIRKKTTDIISEDIVRRKQDDAREIQEMKEREEKLLEESKKAEAGEDPMEPFEHYIMEQVKRAQLLWTYYETKTKMNQMKTSIRASTDKIAEFDKENPEFYEQYRERYFEARRKSGLKDDDNSFLQYLGKDLEEEV